jgi:hypothetical protein
MNESNPLTRRQRSVRPKDGLSAQQNSPDDFSIFIEARDCQSLTNTDFARIVCSLPLFLEKAWLAATIGVHRNGTHRSIDDIQQEATSAYFAHQCKTRGAGFAGTTRDELGAWFYCGLRSHVRWALLSERRAVTRETRRVRRYARHRAASVAESEAVFDRNRALLSEITALDEPLRAIAIDWLREVPVGQTAKQLLISRRTVYRMRARIADILRSRLE